MRNSIFLCLCLTVIPGCVTVLEDSGDPGLVEAGPDVVDLEPPQDGVQLTVGPFELEPYQEVYECSVVKATGDQGVNVVAFEHEGSPTMHHFNAYALGVPMTEEKTGPCDELWDEAQMGLSSPIYASQEQRFRGDFPEGVAGWLPADQWMLLEYHALNATTEPVVTEARLNVEGAPDASVSEYANALYGSNSIIDLEPGESDVITKKCFVDVDMEVFVLASHFHRNGQLFEIFELDDNGDPVDEPVYSSDDWESPLLALFDEPLFIRAGGGFEYRCHYENRSDDHVSYGLTSDEEMCMMVGVYYPDQGFKYCKSSRPVPD